MRALCDQGREERRAVLGSDDAVDLALPVEGDEGRRVERVVAFVEVRAGAQDPKI
jgi:hypothetical protein